MSKKAFIGRKLREARMYRGKTIDVLAKETNINKKYRNLRKYSIISTAILIISLIINII